MFMRWIVKSSAVALMLATLLLSEPVPCATVKPLEVVTERMLILETERLASDHSMSAALVRRALERLDKQMNIMSEERTLDSLKLLSDAREALAASVRSSAALSSYVEATASRLKDGGHGRVIPLARLDAEIEKPYHSALDRFLATAMDFVQYCHDNMAAITSGQAQEGKRYDEYYAAYLREMEAFNQQSVKRSRLISDWAAEYPAILEFLPR